MRELLIILLLFALLSSVLVSGILESINRFHLYEEDWQCTQQIIIQDSYPQEFECTQYTKSKDKDNG